MGDQPTPSSCPEAEEGSAQQGDLGLLEPPPKPGARWEREGRALLRSAVARISWNEAWKAEAAS